MSGPSSSPGPPSPEPHPEFVLVSTGPATPTPTLAGDPSGRSVTDPGRAKPSPGSSASGELWFSDASCQTDDLPDGAVTRVIAEAAAERAATTVIDTLLPYFHRQREATRSATRRLEELEAIMCPSERTRNVMLRMGTQFPFQPTRSGLLPVPSPVTPAGTTGSPMWRLSRFLQG